MVSVGLTRTGAAPFVPQATARWQTSAAMAEQVLSTGPSLDASVDDPGALPPAVPSDEPQAMAVVSIAARALVRKEKIAKGMRAPLAPHRASAVPRPASLFARTAIGTRDGHAFQTRPSFTAVA
jgi:hypothetical protein